MEMLSATVQHTISAGVSVAQPDQVSDHCWQMTLFYSLAATTSLLPSENAFSYIKQSCTPEELKTTIHTITLNLP